MKNKYVKAAGFVISVSILFGCGATTQDETVALVQESPSVEVVVNTPVTEEQEQEETEATLAWIEVGNLETNPELRSAMDEIFGVTGGTGEKAGWVYNTQNITLQDALKNEDTLVMLYGEDTNKTQLAEVAGLSYVDVDDLDRSEQIAMAINGYFNLLPDSETGYSNPYQTLTRAQAMTILMRAITPVSEITSDEDFATAVGASEYDIYAQEVNRLAFINTLDGSLNSENFNQQMTKAEAVYMIVQAFYKNAYDNSLFYNDDMTFTDITVSDDLSGSVNIELLDAMLANKGVDNRIYNAYTVAQYHKILGKDTTETEWNEGITKTEFIELLINASTPTETFLYVNSDAVDEDIDTNDETASTSQEAPDDYKYAYYDTDEGSAHIDDAMDHPEKLTDADVEYLLWLCPDLPKNPRDMTSADWENYYANLYTPSYDSTADASDGLGYAPVDDGIEHQEAPPVSPEVQAIDLSSLEVY